jgi:putative ABC transport system permease protein
MLRVTLKGLLAHKIRLLLTTLAVVVGVAFVVGSFVLTDSVRAQFDQLFVDINQGIDLRVRAEEKFEQSSFDAAPAPIPQDLVDVVAGIDGVAEAQPSIGVLPARAIDKDGEALTPAQAPPLGTNWFDSDQLNPLIMREGNPPEADDEIAMDLDLAERGDFQVGDRIPVQTAAEATNEYELVGIFSFGENNALSGASMIAFTTPEVQRAYNLEDQIHYVEVALEDGADPDVVQDAIAAELPDDIEVITGEEATLEDQEDIGGFIDAFGNVLLGFALVTLFVSAFLINNTFTIVVGQRVRELGLLRAVGATERQIFTSVMLEALAVGILASIIGFGLGILTALALNGFLNAAGFGAGETKLVVNPSTFVAAFVIGVAVTLIAALLPARRATTIPPIAALREGFTFQGVSQRTRSIIGGVLTIVGLALIANALFTDPGTIGLLTGMAVGALLTFLGVAALSSVFAAPAAQAIGSLFSRRSRLPGRLAKQNAARSPRRTASTASALMIGLALVSMTLVVGNSVKATLADTLGTSVQADWLVQDETGWLPFSADVATALQDLPELTDVMRGRFGQMEVDESRKDLTAVDFGELTALFDLDIQEGSVDAETHGLMIHSDPAEDLGVGVGDTVTATFQQTGEVELPVVAVFDDPSALQSNWLIDMQTYEENFAEREVFFVAALTAPDTTPEEARAALDGVLEDAPGLQAQDKEEFQEDTEAQLNGLLQVVNVFLLMAIVIAFIGIVNTLALSVFERTRELGLLQAVGMTARQVRRMIRVEAVIVAIFGALLGVIVGMVFGFAVGTALPTDFVSTISPPWSQIVILVLLAAILGVVAAIWPARRASKLDVLQAISTE